MSPRHTSTAALAALLAAVACAASGCASSASAPPADTASIAERAAQLGVDPGLVFTTSVEGYDLAPQSVSPVDDAGLTATWFDESTSAMISIRTSPGAPTAESCAAMPLWDAPGEAVTCTEESGLWHREGGGTHEFLAARDDATILVLGGNGAPVDDLHSNWAYMLIAALAWNIKSWHAIMMHRNNDRTSFVRMEFKRFLHTVIRIPAMVLARARSIVVRLVAYTVNLDRFFSAWATTERTRFGYG